MEFQIFADGEKQEVLEEKLAVYCKTVKMITIL